MIISDETLHQHIADGTIGIEPLVDGQVQPASVDIRLGNNFLVLDEHGMSALSLDDEIHYREIEAEEIIVPPKSFLLATTMEYIRLPNNVTAFVEGRSSIGRMGLFIQNAGWVDPGFEGEITLEVFNANSLPIKLTAGRRICQLVFAFMDKETKNPYRGKYQGQRKAKGSLVRRDVEAIEVRTAASTRSDT
jgi:dCTP deaminase